MNILRVSNVDNSYCYDHSNRMVTTSNVINNNRQNISFRANYGNSTLVTDKFIQLVKMGYSNKYLVNFAKGNLNSLEHAETLIDIRLTGFEKRGILSSYNHKVSNDEIEQLFFEEPEKTLNVVNILGKKSFISSFNNKFENVKNYINTIGNISPQHPLYQNLIELTNPQESVKYKNITEQITNLKKQFQTTTNKKELIKHINNLTDANKNLVKNSITDYPEKIEIAEFFYTMRNSHDILDSVLNAYDKHNKINLFKKLNDVAKTDSNGQICKQFDFVNNDYLSKMFTTDMSFKTSYDELLKTLNKNPDKSVREVLLGLPQNKETKTEFENLGVNFERWTKFNPESKLEKEVVINDKQKNIIKYLEDTLTSPMLPLISDEKRALLENEIQVKGYKMKTEMPPLINNLVGVMNREVGPLKLHKNNKRMSFNDLPELVNTIDDFLKNNSNWNSPDKTPQMTLAREVFEKNIQDVKKGMFLALKNPNPNKVKITAQQIDMNNIAHSLFLGNDSSCCMAIGTGYKQAIAPNYIKNKMVSGIEVLVDDKSVGNTICYIAEVDKKPALVLDNIEIKPNYRKDTVNDDIRDLMFSYARKFTKELGNEDMPIYLGHNRNKINLRGYQKEDKNIKIVGTSGDDRIYIDSVTKEGKFGKSNVFDTCLYNISGAKHNQDI